MPEENLLLDFYGARENNRGRHTAVQMGATQSGLISNPPSTSPQNKTTYNECKKC